MPDFNKDPVQNAIQNGLKEDIEIMLQAGRWRGVLVLIYSGIDVMAFLDMPSGQIDVTRTDFIRWCNRYLTFPCVEKLPGEDLYGARCSLLHSYTTQSRMSRDGKCRQIIYADQSIPEILANPAIDPTIVSVSILALKESFFQGIDRFLVAGFTDKDKAPILEQRLNTVVLQVPFKGVLSNVEN